MKKFVAIYHMPADAQAEAAKSTPEEREESMKEWYAWKERIGAALVDFGAPLTAGKNLTPGGASDSGSDVAGYSIVQAEDLDSARQLFDNHPHLGWNASCNIELFETIDM